MVEIGMQSNTSSQLCHKFHNPIAPSEDDWVNFRMGCRHTQGVKAYGRSACYPPMHSSSPCEFIYRKINVACLRHQLPGMMGNGVMGSGLWKAVARGVRHGLGGTKYCGISGSTEPMVAIFSGSLG